MYNRSHFFFYILIFIIATFFFSQKVVFAATTTLNITAVVHGGGGGGGNGGTPPVIPTEVNFSGKAYPNRIVTLLKDAQLIDKTTASSDSDFEIVVTGLVGGTYLFSFYTEDIYETRSDLVTMSVNVINGAKTTVSGIFLPPTIETDKSIVKQGDELIIFGQAVGDGEVMIEINSGTTSSSTTMTTDASGSGLYEYNFDTTEFSFGDYTVKAKATFGEAESSYGKTIAFSVEDENIFKEPTFFIGDLNDDRRVDVVDFSIAAFWYKRPLSEEFAEIETERLNGDGKIDLIDFSIMAYYWTG